MYNPFFKESKLLGRYNITRDNTDLDYRRSPGYAIIYSANYTPPLSVNIDDDTTRIVSIGNRILPVESDGYDSIFQRPSGKPKAILDTVEIAVTGDFGSLRRAKVSFKCFDRDALTEFTETIMKTGRSVFIEIGYNNDRGILIDPTNTSNPEYTGRVGPYEFVVYKYEYSIDKNLIYNCSFEAIAPGRFNFAQDTDQLVGSLETEYTPKIKYRVVRSRNRSEKRQLPIIHPKGMPLYDLARSLQGGTDYSSDYTLDSDLKTNQLIPIDENGIKTTSDQAVGHIATFKRPKTVESIAGIRNYKRNNLLGIFEGRSEFLVYVDLGYIFNRMINGLINNERVVREITAPELKDVRFRCDAEVSYAGFSEYATFSTRPLDVLIIHEQNMHLNTSWPSGDNTDNAGSQYRNINTHKSYDYNLGTDIVKESENGYFGLSQLRDVIFTDNNGNQLLDLSKIFVNINTFSGVDITRDRFGKMVKLDLKDFIENIFSIVEEATAGVYSLCVVPNQQNKKPNGDITEYIVTVKDPPQTRVTRPFIFDPLPGNKSNINVSLDVNLPNTQAAAAYAANLGSISPAHSDEIAEEELTHGERPQTRKERERQRREIIERDVIYIKYKGLHDSGYEDASQINALRAYIKSRYTNEDPKEKIRTRTPECYPELTLQLNGVHGFEFGDHVEIQNLLPDIAMFSGRNDANLKLGFTVIEVRHKVVKNQWITELDTKARLTNAS